MVDGKSTIPGGEIVRDAAGRPVLVRGGTAHIRQLLPPEPRVSRDETLTALAKLLRRYNEVGITGIFERATDRAGFDIYRTLRDRGELTTRVTATFRFSARTAAEMLMLGIAVSRKTHSGRVYGPHQRLSRLDALRSVTTWAAYLGFDESDRGSLAPGKLADLVVIDRDYLTCPAEQIRDIRVCRTMVGGKTVYQREKRP